MTSGRVVLCRYSALSFLPRPIQRSGAVAPRLTFFKVLGASSGVVAVAAGWGLAAGSTLSMTLTPSADFSAARVELGREAGRTMVELAGTQERVVGSNRSA